MGLDVRPIRPDLKAPPNQPNIGSRAIPTLWKIEHAHLPGVIVIGLSNRNMSVRDALNAEGLAGVSLAESGATASQIMAITGHKILQEAEKYIRAADQKRLAKSAIGIIDGSKNG